MSTELFLVRNGEIHKIDDDLMWNLITVCGEIFQKANNGVRLSNNPQGRRCAECFSPVPRDASDSWKVPEEGLAEEGASPNRPGLTPVLNGSPR